VLIHVGLHRTGTTYLQKRVFPRLKGMRYAKKPSSARIERLAAEREAPRPLLISHEGLLARKRDGRARPERLGRLAELFPDAEPMLTVRRHDRWARSLYVYNIYKGHRHSFETFLRQREVLTLMPHVRLLERVFDRPPRILFQEELEEAPEAAAELLAQWAGASLRSTGRRRRRVNPGLSDAGLGWVLRMNRRFPRGEKAPPPYRWAQKLSRHLGAMTLSRLGTWCTSGTGGRSAIIDEEALRAVRLRYRGDWISLLRYVSVQRRLLAPSLRPELDNVDR
jgi:hypothetical protein